MGDQSVGAWLCARMNQRVLVHPDVRDGSRTMITDREGCSRERRQGWKGGILPTRGDRLVWRIWGICKASSSEAQMAQLGFNG